MSLSGNPPTQQHPAVQGLLGLCPYTPQSGLKSNLPASLQERRGPRGFTPAQEKWVLHRDGWRSCASSMQGPALHL